MIYIYLIVGIYLLAFSVLILHLYGQFWVKKYDFKWVSKIAGFTPKSKSEVFIVKKLANPKNNFALLKFSLFIVDY